MNDILRYKNILISALIIFIFWTVFNNILKKNSNQSRILKRQEKILTEGEENIKKWEDLNTEYSRLQTEFLRGDILNFKKFVEESAEKFKFKISSLNVSHTDKGTYWEVSLQLRSSSRYKNFVSFLKAIETKKIQVDNLRLLDSYGNIKTDLKLRGAVYK